MIPAAFPEGSEGLTFRNTLSLLRGGERFTHLTSYPEVEKALVEVLVQSVMGVTEKFLQVEENSEAVDRELRNRVDYPYETQLAVDLTRWLIGDVQMIEGSQLHRLREELIDETDFQLSDEQRCLAYALSLGDSAARQLQLAITFYRKDLLEALEFPVPLLSFDHQKKPERHNFPLELKKAKLIRIPLPTQPIEKCWPELFHAGLGEYILREELAIFSLVDEFLIPFLPELIDDLLMILNLGPSAILYLKQKLEMDLSEGASTRCHFIFAVEKRLQVRPGYDPGMGSPFLRAAEILIRLFKERVYWDDRDSIQLSLLLSESSKPKSSPRNTPVYYRVAEALTQMEKKEPTEVYQSLLEDLEAMTEEENRQPSIPSPILGPSGISSSEEN